MDVYMNRGGSYAHSNDSSSSLSGSSSFDSFSSADSTASWDMVATPPPSRRKSYDPYDRNGRSCSRTSMSSSPTEHHDYLTPIPYGMIGVPDQSMMYSPCHKNMVNQGMMAYDFQFANTMCAPYDDQEYVNDPPSLMFDSSSPLAMEQTPILSPHHYVNPTQTFLESYQPATMRTPRKTSRTALASSPMDEYHCQNRQQLQYFMSPVQPHSASRSARSSISSASSKSSSTSSMSASSAALHRVQDTTSRVGKRCKDDKFGSGITRVVAGKFFCTFPGCEKSKNHAFKRQEHLKRHLLTHTQPRDLSCLFCHKSFQNDRRDNWKAHIGLHAKPQTKGKRTRFDPRAKAMVELWEQEKKEAGDEALSPAAEIVRESIRRNETRLAIASF